MKSAFKYLIFPQEDETGDEALVRSVKKKTTAYLQDVVLPLLRPLADQDYVEGPHAILMTPAHYVYVLHASGDVFWCVEWEPGLLVLRFTAAGRMDWCALKSPVPEFGGRAATEEEIEAWDEDAPNPQYDLIFDAWDPQSDPTDRKGWVRATAKERKAWEDAMAHANQLGSQILALPPGEKESWMQRCQESPIWKGSDVHGE